MKSNGQTARFREAPHPYRRPSRRRSRRSPAQSSVHAQPASDSQSGSAANAAGAVLGSARNTLINGGQFTAAANVNRNVTINISEGVIPQTRAENRSGRGHDELLKIHNGGSTQRQPILGLRAELNLLPSQHADRSSCLLCLADALSRRFDQWGQRDDLEEAIWCYQEALSLLPNSHYQYLETLLGLCSSIYQRVLLLGCADDLKNLLRYLELEHDVLHQRRSLLAPVEAQLEKPHKDSGSAEGPESENIIEESKKSRSVLYPAVVPSNPLLAISLPNQRMLARSLPIKDMSCSGSPADSKPPPERRTTLFSLPDELISLLSFYVLALTPLGPPQALLTLALTCRVFNLVVTSNTFKAKICRFMFDVRAISRRLFHPRDTDLADELHRCCDILKEIRRGDIAGTSSVVDDTLIAAYVLMLNNDGKNYAQLEHAGLDAYVDKFIRARLWEGRETSQGWPLDNSSNSSALWLMWMTLTKQKLAAESPAAREEKILLTLPYVVLPHRYASACAPPNHFNLPLDSKNPYHQQPLIKTVAPETPYPIYLQNSSMAIPYFNARLPMYSPLVTIAAKLLFVARKETFPIRAPPHLPQGPGVGVVGMTQEDYREINRSPGARLCRLVTWDWETGTPKRVGREENDGDEIEEEGWEESKVWDTEWWRRLLCGNCDVQRPKHLPGDVFKLGSMKGSWQGREYLPQGNLFVHFLRHPNVHYPGIPDPHRPHLFTESSIGLSMKPVFLDIEEHHKICECPQGFSSHSNNSDFHPYVAPTPSFTTADAPSSSSPSSVPIVSSQSGRCGVVPIPAPLVFISSDEQRGQNEEVNIQIDEPQSSDVLALSLPSSKISIIDYSMSNAWFPGHLGGVSFTKLPSISGENAKRDKVICAVDFQAPDVRSVLSRPGESECLALGGRRQQGQAQGKMNAYVYETYDPEKMSMHRGLETVSGAGVNAFTSRSISGSNANSGISDGHKCPRCIQREALIRLERKKAEQHFKMMLDRGLRSYGRSGGYDWNQGKGMFCDEKDMDKIGDGEGDEEMQDVDVTELGIDVEEIIAQSTSGSSSGSASPIQLDDDEGSSTQIISFGDDEQEHVDLLDMTHQTPQRNRCYDKSRIGVECRGVGDILLSGETGPRYAAWQQYTMYGRVRPWDGLIGILRSANITNNTFIFGYIVGENNFVGEWRVAGSDPLSPTLGGAFVMSRRAGRGRASRGGGEVPQTRAPVNAGVA